MTPYQEKELLNIVRLLKKELLFIKDEYAELKERLNVYLPNSDELISSKQAKMLLGWGETKFYSELNANRIPSSVKLDGRWRFSKEALIKFIGNTQ